jgi:hypothetical protein
MHKKTTPERAQTCKCAVEATLAVLIANVLQAHGELESSE